MPTASVNAIGLIVPVPSGMKEAKTKIMISAAAVTTRTPPANPRRTDRR